jgi:hypothetical protein
MLKLHLACTLLAKKIKRSINRVRVRNKPKIFCIGRNKTGTTSVTLAFKELGYIIGEQDVAEHLFEKHYLTGNYQPIIDYCKSAQVFQDVPFSFYQMIPILDQAFPNSKFILTIRDTPEQWHRSFVKYYSKGVGIKDRPATYDELNTKHYVSDTFRANFIVKAHSTTKESPFDQEKLMSIYNEHNDYIAQYFHKRPNDLLTINIAEKSSFNEFLAFINERSETTQFPWENKT